MKLQGIAVVFILILLPLTLVLSTYTQLQIKTLALQKSYDSKLIDATYDAVAALQLNTANEDLSNVADSFRSIVEASNNVFINTMSTNLGISNASKSYLSPYVPAILTTLYDGYYIYSPTKVPEVVTYDSNLVPDGGYGYGFEINSDNANSSFDKDVLFPEDNYKLEKDAIEQKNGQVVKDIAGQIYYIDKNGGHTTNLEDAKYKVDYILKPFSAYTARYVKDDIDITVHYTLDNFITVEGTIKGVYFTESGYLIAEEVVTDTGNEIEIKSQDNDGNDVTTCITLDSTLDSTSDEYQEKLQAMTYYREAYSFTKWVKKNLNDLTEADLKISDEVKKASSQVINGREDSEYVVLDSNIKMFQIDATNNPEQQESNFVQHKQKVLRQSIIYNLNAAITAYNESGLQAETNFKLPVISNTEWSKILNNVTMVTFLQGIKCGGKIYNNYAVVPSSNNELVVTPESLYFVNREKDKSEAEDSTYHRIDCPELDTSEIDTGYRGIEFLYTNKAYKVSEEENEKKGRIIHKSYACYHCIVNGNYNAVDWKEDEERRKLYYTILGKERNQLYKSVAVPENYGYYYSLIKDKDDGNLLTMGPSNHSQTISGLLIPTYTGSNLKSVVITLNQSQYIDRTLPLIKYRVKINDSEYGEITIQTNMENSQTFEISISSDVPAVNSVTFELSTGQTLRGNHTFRVTSILSKYQ